MKVVVLVIYRKFLVSKFNVYLKVEPSQKIMLSVLMLLFISWIMKSMDLFCFISY